MVFDGKFIVRILVTVLSFLFLLVVFCSFWAYVTDGSQTLEHWSVVEVLELEFSAQYRDFGEANFIVVFVLSYHFILLVLLALPLINLVCQVWIHHYIGLKTVLVYVIPSRVPVVVVLLILCTYFVFMLPFKNSLLLYLNGLGLLFESFEPHKQDKI